MELGKVRRGGPAAPGRRRRIGTLVVLGALLTVPSAARAADGQVGVLLLAHGGAKSWNELITTLASNVNRDMPIEVAFGMADRSAIQGAVDRLVQRGVARIVAVPLFVSSHSSVFESSEYLLGARAEAPADLAMFARMHHGSGGSAPAVSHDMAGHNMAGHNMAAQQDEDGTRPVSTPVPIRVARALDHDQAVVDILTARARALSRTPEREHVIIVAHGPTSDEENEQWLQDMRIVAAGVRRAVPFAGVEPLTVRDDAPEPIRGAAAKDLREAVMRASSRGERVLIVPLLLAYGGIEGGIRERLSGLDYEMASQGLLPDDRLVRWVIDTAQAAR